MNIAKQIVRSPVGMAGERFAVRNSGAAAVVDGTGHHLVSRKVIDTQVEINQ